MIHQMSNATNYNRYPDIFNECKKLFGNEKNDILSFGCSTGEEILTLKEIYFTNCEIYGVEINEDNIKKCLEKIKSNYIFNYDDFLENDEKYDAIFAMSCLCKWEDTELVENSSAIYPFENFESIIKILDNKLNKNGHIVIYNANYIFEETSISQKYKKILTPSIIGSGKVHKFNKDNKKIYDCNYDGVIFRKIYD